MSLVHSDLALAAIDLGWLCVALSICGAIYACVAMACVRSFMARPLPPASRFPSVTLLKPLHGDERGLLENLEAFCAQDYPGPVQVIFGVHGASDPAIAVVETLKRRHPALDIDLVVDTRLHGANRKISNLLNMLPRVAHEVVVLSDSDIGVEPDYLRKVTASLEQPGVGVVSCLYVGHGSGGVWSKLSALGVNHHFLPNAVLGMRFGLAEPCFGATIAIPRTVLEEMDGLGAFSNHLADDYEIGREIRRRGYKLAMPPIAVTHTCSEASARQLIDHELRWSRTIRLIDGPGYAGSLITHPLPLAILGAAMTNLAPEAVGMVAVAVVVRLSLAMTVDRATGARSEPWRLIIARDMLSFAVFVAAFFVGGVSWQGRNYQVESDGLLIPIEEN